MSGRLSGWPARASICADRSVGPEFESAAAERVGQPSWPRGGSTGRPRPTPPARNATTLRAKSLREGKAPTGGPRWRAGPGPGSQPAAPGLGRRMPGKGAGRPGVAASPPACLHQVHAPLRIGQGPHVPDVVVTGEILLEAIPVVT